MTLLQKALLNYGEKLMEYKEGGLPFNVLIDNEYYKGNKLFISPTLGGRAFTSTVVTKDGVATEYNQDSFPRHIFGNEIEVATNRLEYGIIYMPEYRTVLVYTEDFYKKASASISGYTESEKVNPRDWVTLMLRLNVYTIMMKSSAISKMKEGKAKGLSKTELSYIQDSMVPIYIRADTDRLSASNAFESYIGNSIHKAAVFMDNLILSEIELASDGNVYFGGYKCFRAETTARTCYTPKIMLLNKGLKTVGEFYSHLMQRVHSLPEEQLNDIYNKVAVVLDLDVADVEE